MRVTYRHLFFALAAAAGFVGTAASAEDAPPPPPPAFTINGGATVVTDYRFRGISQTDRNVAVQGTATLGHSSGFYLTFWGSSVDDYVTASGQSHQELDLIGGFKKTFGHTTIDTGILYYVYPKTKLVGDRSSSNFFEPYFSVAEAIGPVTAKATVNYAPKQKALALNQIGPKLDNLYIAGDLSAAIPHAPIGLTAHLGHTFGPSWLSIGRGYTDWGLGATVSYHQLTFGVQYVDTNGAFITPTGKNASKAGIVGSVGVSF
jgi:uncharacterized protein (TIGR02001 family)